MTFAVAQGDYVLGGYDRKELDVGLYSSTSGPLLGISIKSMMSSIGKNVMNRWEELVGDAANMHSRFPMAVFGLFFVVPFSNGGETIITGPNPGDVSPLGQLIERKLLAITGRAHATSLPSEYEEATLVVVNFDADPPTLSPHFPAPGSVLRLDSFFDRLRLRLGERNRYLPL